MNNKRPKGHIWSHPSDFQKSKHFREFNYEDCLPPREKAFLPDSNGAVLSAEAIAAKRRRIEELAQRFLDGQPLFLSSARPCPQDVRRLFIDFERGHRGTDASPTKPRMNARDASLWHDVDKESELLRKLGDACPLGRLTNKPTDHSSQAETDTAIARHAGSRLQLSSRTPEVILHAHPSKEALQQATALRVRPLQTESVEFSVHGGELQPKEQTTWLSRLWASSAGVNALECGGESDCIDAETPSMRLELRNHQRKGLVESHERHDSGVTSDTTFSCTSDNWNEPKHLYHPNIRTQSVSLSSQEASMRTAPEITEIYPPIIIARHQGSTVAVDAKLQSTDATVSQRESRISPPTSSQAAKTSSRSLQRKQKHTLDQAAGKVRRGYTAVQVGDASSTPLLLRRRGRKTNCDEAVHPKLEEGRQWSTNLPAAFNGIRIAVEAHQSPRTLPNFEEPSAVDTSRGNSSSIRRSMKQNMHRSGVESECTSREPLSSASDPCIDATEVSDKVAEMLTGSHIIPNSAESHWHSTQALTIQAEHDLFSSPLKYTETTSPTHDAEFESGKTTSNPVIASHFHQPLQDPPQGQSQGTQTMLADWSPWSTLKKPQSKRVSAAQIWPSEKMKIVKRSAGKSRSAGALYSSNGKPRAVPNANGQSKRRRRGPSFSLPSASSEAQQNQLQFPVRKRSSPSNVTGLGTNKPDISATTEHHENHTCTSPTSAMLRTKSIAQLAATANSAPETTFATVTARPLQPSLLQALVQQDES